MDIKLSLQELSDEQILSLKAGDNLLLSGTLYTARDAAHKRMCEDFEKGKGFPFDIKGQAIYYAGPCPAKPNEVIGSCGPTTSGRMDAYSPLLLDNGLKIMIGKGGRNETVKDAVVRNRCLYLGAVGGCGALIADCIKKAEIIAYPDLGTEAIRRLWVEDFPCTVLLDAYGNDFYKSAQEPYKRR
ncbi:MAG: Fe-S-containing hydro-lyase [Clostridia bacterium]|nr:Fe-S-containing hydro-lyase [Clostridia bacterium]